MSNNEKSNALDALKACPFCGLEARLYIRNRQYAIICSNHRCIAHDIEPRFTDPISAAWAWNTRVDYYNLYNKLHDIDDKIKNMEGNKNDLR